MELGSKNILTYFTLLLWLFILLFFTKNYFFDYEQNKNNLTELNTENNKLESEINSLNKNLNDLEKNKNETIKKEDLDKYIINFTENNFVEYFYSIWEDFEIEKLDIDKWKLDKNGFIKWNINISLQFLNEEEMKEFLNRLIDNDSKYKFYIENFEFPMWKMWNWNKTKINISMYIYYKNKSIKK